MGRLLEGAIDVLKEKQNSRYYPLDEKKEVDDKAKQFADIVFNRKGWVDRLLMKDRGLQRQAAEQKLVKHGFSADEVTKLRSWLKKATENVAGNENIYMVRMPDNFSGWGFTVGSKDAAKYGMREIGSMEDEREFNRKIQKEFLRLAKQHNLT